MIVKPTKVIAKGAEALKATEDLVAPRNMKPWQKIENLNEDGSIKETKVKSMADSISKAKVLNETDAKDFDVLLEGIPTPPTQSQNINTKSTTPGTSNTPTTTATTKNAPKVKSVVVRVEEKKEEKEKQELILKRDWAWKAETDEEWNYYSNRRAKCLESIRDLKTWTKENVVDFEPGRLFETLLSHEGLFDNPGLQSHSEADVYLDKVNDRRNAGRKSNSFEIGFRCFARKIFFDVFKDKAHGLVNRNFSGLRGWTKSQQMISLGKFMDKLLDKAEETEDDSDGAIKLELNRFEVETLIDEYIPFTISNKAGSIEIEVYAKDVCIFEDDWLLLLLKHASFAWENFTMVRAKLKSIRTSRLNLYFRNKIAEEYYEGQSLLNVLLRNPNTLPPGNWSKIFM